MQVESCATLLLTIDEVEINENKKIQRQRITSCTADVVECIIWQKRVEQLVIGILSL